MKLLSNYIKQSVAYHFIISNSAEYSGRTQNSSLLFFIIRSEYIHPSYQMVIPEWLLLPFLAAAASSKAAFGNGKKITGSSAVPVANSTEDYDEMSATSAKAIGSSQSEAAASASAASKRGKKGKQKKIREKYKDQDEEEKELRMQLLHDAQKLDGKRAKKKKKEEQMKVDKENKLARAKAMNQKRQQPGQTFQQASTMHDARRGSHNDDGGDGDQDVGADSNATAGNAIKVSDEVDMIDALTG